MNIKALFEQMFGFGGPERGTDGVALPTALYICVIPQEDVIITAITIASNVDVATNYVGKPLAAGIPWYCPFTTATFSGNVDAYKAKEKWTTRVTADGTP